MGDTAYGTAELLNWLLGKGIAPHSPVWEKTNHTNDNYSATSFTFDKQANEYICPNNKRLHTTNKPTKDNALIYRSRVPDCRDCKDKQECCPNSPLKKVGRSIYEEAREITREINKTSEYKQSRNDRKKVEVLFGHLKRILRFNRLRLRGLTGAHDEFLLAATAQNLKNMAKLYSQPPLLTG